MASSTPALDANHRPSKIFFHDIGMESSGDRLIYEEADPGFFMSVGGTRSNEWIFISINDHETSEYRILLSRRSAGRAARRFAA